MQTRLNALADQYYQEYMRKITVLRAWIEYSGDDDVEDPTSLHYEGIILLLLLLLLGSLMHAGSIYCSVLCFHVLCSDL